MRLFSNVEAGEESSLKLNLPDMKLPSLEDGGISFTLNAHNDIPSEKPKRKTSSRKKEKVSLDGVVTDTISGGTQQDDMITTNKPYETKYQETTGLLRGAIVQLDSLLNDTMQDAAVVRSSKTLRRKYDLLSLLKGHASQIIGNKITAIREINSTISKCNDLELKRMKELNFAAANEDSDKKIMDMYNAFVTMPVGDPGMSGMMGANNLAQISHSLSMGNVVTSDTQGEDDAAYRAYLNNMNPAQRLNMYENNPNVKQVVVYNQQTGARYFEVMDLSTGEVIPGVDKHDPMFLENTTLDLEHKIARNIDIGESYPIVIVGEPVANAY